MYTEFQNPKTNKTIKNKTPQDLGDDWNDITFAPFSTENKNLGNESYLDTVGYHYCKILSPARAMEWIYIDGLKVTDGDKP